ncbi:MAG: (2Fe-2S) ferredoxin domain-containing protein [Prochlorotrichaceae cyanobacterium]
MCSPSPTTPPWLFDLEGTVLGFPDNSRTKVKYLALEVEQEQMIVILPKELRHPQRLNLQPGDRVRCIGRSRLDTKAKAIELKAYQIFSLPGVTVPQGQVPLRLQQTVVESDPLVSPSDKAKKPLKILICQKSGCQKRGGRVLVDALEKLLIDRNLQDKVTIKYTGCQKRCSKAPTLTMPDGRRYDQVNLKSLANLFDEYFHEIAQPVFP